MSQTSTQQPLRRAALYMPASNTRALEKAKSLSVDVMMFDLEDSVAPDVKEQARANLVEALAFDYGGREIAARVNGIGTPWFDADIKAAVAAGPAAIVVPKVSTPDELNQVCDAVSNVDPSVHVWPMLETPLAIMNATDLSRAAAARDGQVNCFLIGTNDLAKESGVSTANDRAALLPWLMTMVACAKAAGASILDSVYNDFRDQDGLARECEQGRSLGMDGKTIIHPAQIEVASAAFTPSEDEIAWAKRIVETFADPAHASKGVIQIDGEMVERLHLDMATKLLASLQRD